MGLLKTVCKFLVLVVFIGNGQVFANELTKVENAAAPCFACHGEKGNSMNAAIPKLAGQQAVYIVKQLKAFKSGIRKSSVMQAQAQKLSDEDINNFGAYFTVQEVSKSDVASSSMPTTGKEKASQCLGCHGSLGEGNGQYPRLAGQHTDYLIQQLQSFKSGQRTNGAMQAISGSLTNEDIGAIAVFFSRL